MSTSPPPPESSASGDTPDALTGSPSAAPRNGSLLNPWVFWPSTIVILSFVGVTMVFPEAMTAGIGTVQSAIIYNFSWWYALLAFGLVVFCLLIGFSRMGRITMGKPDDTPEFSTLSWFSLLFAAGMGIGLVFYGMTEPLSHFATPQPGVAAEDPSTGVLAENALSTTFLHWGLQPWAIYAVVGMAIGLAIHRRGRPLSMRWGLEPLIGEKATRGGWGHLVDNIALIGTVFGVATSLGLGVTQMSAGLRSLGAVPEDSPWVEYVMIALITCVVLWSVVSGVGRGMKWLSNTNLILAAGLLLFLAIVGPTQFLLKEMVQSLGGYLQNYVSNSLDVSAFYGAAGDEWQAGWTAYYWGWWMSWTPFVGIFIARISRGRTIRQFIFGVILAPTLISVMWFGVLGGTAIFLEATRPPGYVSVIGEGGSVDANAALFQVLEQLPAGGLLVVGAILLSAIFFITSSDSGSLVMGMIATGGDPEPRHLIRVFFAIATALMAAALLLAGGLQAIQTLAITIGLPFGILIVLLCIATLRALRTSVNRVEAVRRKAFLTNISERFGLETDDDVVDTGPVAANAWWAGLSRDRQDKIAELAQGDGTQGRGGASRPGRRLRRAEEPDRR